MSDSNFSIEIWEGDTAQEALENYWKNCPPQGNDSDYIGAAVTLFQGGHYRESMEFSIQVQPTENMVTLLPDVVDKEAANQAIIAAFERSMPFLEAAAREMEGEYGPYGIMEMLSRLIEAMKNNPDEEFIP